MAKRGVTRKQLLKEPDEFIVLSTRVIEWCRQYPRQLTYGACALVAAVIIVVGYGYYHKSRSRAADSLLSQSITEYLAADTDPEQTNDLGTDFEQLTTRFGNLPAGKLGLVYFAHYNLSEGAFDEAIVHYSKAMDDFGGDSSLTNILLHGLALANEQKGDVTAAIGYFEKIAGGESALLKDTALFHLGMLYGRTNDSEKSVSAFQKLSVDFPDSLYTPIAQDKISG